MIAAGGDELTHQMDVGVHSNLQHFSLSIKVTHNSRCDDRNSICTQIARVQNAGNDRNNICTHKLHVYKMHVR